MKRLNTTIVTACSLLIAGAAAAADNGIQLSYGNGRHADDVASINAVLAQAGVHVTAAAVPKAAWSLAKTSKTRPLTAPEQHKLLSLYALDRTKLLKQIEAAGRQPQVAGGGSLTTTEVGVSPYPKVYDMKALSDDARHAAQLKFGKLHVNLAENNVGIDEVMTVVSGGPWAWFFRLPDGTVAKLKLTAADSRHQGWRLSYTGAQPHGAFLYAPYGLVVAHAHGPKVFEMSYKAPAVAGAELLGTNPWIRFNAKTAELKE